MIACTTEKPTTKRFDYSKLYQYMKPHYVPNDRLDLSNHPSVIATALVDYTTAHGFRSHYLSRGSVKKGFWLAVMLAMTGALLYNLVNLTNKLLANEVDVSLTVSSNTHLTFPAVTVCNMSPVKRSSLAASEAQSESTTSSSASGKRRKKRAITEINDCLFHNGTCAPHAKCTQISDNTTACVCDVGFSGDGFTCDALINLALHRPTWQSTTDFSGESSRAVDGGINTTYSNHSCSHTATGDLDPWWAVDLGQPHVVQGVILYNREDCCGSRLNNFVVGLTNSPPNVNTPSDTNMQRCGQWPGMALGGALSMRCTDGLQLARYVVIMNHEQYLAICELQVFSLDSDATTEQTMRVTTLEDATTIQLYITTLTSEATSTTSVPTMTTMIELTTTTPVTTATLFYDIIGCFADDFVRDLPYPQNNALPSACAEVCYSEGFEYAGSQFKGECYCGHSYGSHGPSNGCTMTCTADPSQICGGSWANTIMYTRYGVTTEQTKRVTTLEDAKTIQLTKVTSEATSTTSEQTMTTMIELTTTPVTTATMMTTTEATSTLDTTTAQQLLTTMELTSTAAVSTLTSASLDFTTTYLLTTETGAIPVEILTSADTTIATRVMTTQQTTTQQTASTTSVPTTSASQLMSLHMTTDTSAATTSMLISAAPLPIGNTRQHSNGACTLKPTSSSKTEVTTVGELTSVQAKASIEQTTQSLQHANTTSPLPILNCCCRCCYNTASSTTSPTCNTCGQPSLSGAVQCASIVPITTTPLPTKSPKPNFVAAQPLVGSKYEDRLVPTVQFSQTQQFTEKLAALSATEKSSLGFNAADFILDCNYGDIECNLENDFEQFYSPVQGNCFIFNSGWNSSGTLRTATQPGRRYGLSMTMNIQQDEYVPAAGDTAGAVFVIQAQNLMPFPEDSGIVVSPGQVTSIGITRKTVKRLPAPYGDCWDVTVMNNFNNAYADRYPVNYSTVACQKTCYQRNVIDQCHCYDAYYPDSNNTAFNFVTVPVCSAQNITQGDCMYGITSKFVNGELDCNCPNRCSDVIYSLESTSFYAWPSIISQGSILSSLKSKLGSSLNIEESSFVGNNLLKVEIFFNDFSSEDITESPAYPILQFISDAGGVLGLWFGFAVMTFVEFFECFIDVTVLLIIKFFRMTLRKQMTSTNG